MGEQAVILSAVTTKSGSVVNPYWYFETDGRLEFRSMDWVMDTSIPSKWHSNTGKTAKTREEAWKKSLGWAAEN